MPSHPQLRHRHDTWRQDTSRRNAWQTRKRKQDSFSLCKNTKKTGLFSYICVKDKLSCMTNRNKTIIRRPSARRIMTTVVSFFLLLTLAASCRSDKDIDLETESALERLDSTLRQFGNVRREYSRQTDSIRKRLDRYTPARTTALSARYMTPCSKDISTRMLIPR